MCCFLRACLNIPFTGPEPLFAFCCGRVSLTNGFGVGSQLVIRKQGFRLISSERWCVFLWSAVRGVTGVFDLRSIRVHICVCASFCPVMPQKTAPRHRPAPRVDESPDGGGSGWWSLIWLFKGSDASVVHGDDGGWRFSATRSSPGSVFVF